jgi:glycosyltransferase involved in cell wall biosynthesis
MRFKLMKITIPYNEILPTGKAHDAFLFREAAELALMGCDVEVLVGKGSRADTLLQNYYGIHAPLKIINLPIIRKNNPLGISWNLPFFHAAEKAILQTKPDVALLSVLKLAQHLVKNRQPDTCYVYEVHELAYYPGTPSRPYFEKEKQLLAACDKIIVTTHQLKKLLMEKPYAIKTPIEVLPLAVESTPLPPPDVNLPPTLTYVGQLYKDQGLKKVIDLMSLVPELQLKIFGGKPHEIAALDPKLPNVHFMGFIPPYQLQQAVIQTHAFIAPFDLVGKMPYVAHTKLYAYQAWGRPIIAPDCPIVQEHVKDALTYTDSDSLLSCLKKIGPDISSPAIESPWPQRIDHLIKIFST